MQWREGLASHSLLTGPTGSLDLEQVLQGYQCQFPSCNLMTPAVTQLEGRTLYVPLLLAEKLAKSPHAECKY